MDVAKEIFEAGLNKQPMPNTCDSLFAELWGKKNCVVEWIKQDSNLESIKAPFIYITTMELFNKTGNTPLRQD